MKRQNDLASVSHGKTLSRNELKAIKGGYDAPLEGGTCRYWIEDADGRMYSIETMSKNQAISEANKIGAGAGWCCDSCPY